MLQKLAKIKLNTKNETWFKVNIQSVKISLTCIMFWLFTDFKLCCSDDSDFAKAQFYCSLFVGASPGKYVILFSYLSLLMSHSLDQLLSNFLKTLCILFKFLSTKNTAAVSSAKTLGQSGSKLWACSCCCFSTECFKSISEHFSSSEHIF